MGHLSSRQCAAQSTSDCEAFSSSQGEIARLIGVCLVSAAKGLHFYHRS